MEDLGYLIQQLIDLVKQTAPELWRIALLQVKVQAIQSSAGLGLGVVLLVAGAFHLAKTIKINGKRKTELEDYWETFAWFISIIPLVAGIFLTIGNSMNLVGYLVNPEYSAIQTLLNLAQ